MPFCASYPCNDVLCATYGCLRPLPTQPAYEPKSPAERQREITEEMLKKNWVDP